MSLKHVSEIELSKSFKLTPKRNYEVEQRVAQQSLFADLEGLLDERNSGQIRTWQVALCLILCSLPYDETSESTLTRSARLGDGSWLTVTFTATGSKQILDNSGNPIIDDQTAQPKMQPIPLPFGADRGPLHYLINRAIQAADELKKQGRDVSEARFVLWESAAEYIEAMNYKKSGKTIKELRARLERIKYCAISVTRTSNSTTRTLVAPMLSRTNLPTSLQPDKRKEKDTNKVVRIGAGEPVLGVELGADFFNEIIAHHFPVPVKLLRATMKRSQLQDYVLTLYWRAFAAKEDTLIPWKAIRQQVWQNDSNPRRLADRMKKAIAVLKAVWPEFRAEVNPEFFRGKKGPHQGLMIGPPKDGIYMLDGVRRRLSDPDLDR